MMNYECFGKLGFGFMRLPRCNDKFDFSQINEMVDLFIENGFDYFDTAYIYEGSEDALKKSLVERYPRHKYKVATKMPIYMLESSDGISNIFNTSMKRLGLDYIDNYLIHGIDKEQSEKAEVLGAWEFIFEQKQKGLIKNIGFSFHGVPEDLESILSNHHDVDFVQIQINYIDWDSSDVQSRKLYDIVRKHKKPIVVMEPVKGGLLSSETSHIAELYRNVNPKASPASWAIRYVASLEGVDIVLSGMSSVEQVKDNIITMKEKEKLNENELSTIARAITILNNTDGIQCTQCGYCMSNCPKNLNISQFINLYNDYLTFGTTANLKHMYDFFAGHGKTAVACISCYSCETRCPQKLKIVEVMSKISVLFDLES